jgi:hypothetical protein
MKEYLLLRNNKQSGPYSAEDLRSMGLRALDLVWIEKKSSCWRYPSEIRELAPFVPPAEETIVTPSLQDRKVINIAEKFIAGKTISPSKTDAIPVKTGEVKHTNHIITMKPRVDQIRVKTIKSIGQSRILNVQIRDNDSMEKAPARVSTSPVNTTAAPDNIYLSAEDRNEDPGSAGVLIVPGGANKFFSIKAFPGDTDNKLELMVLMIGAISLLAIAYLLITSPY